uniref:Nucleoprotein TPR n=1 Tax=Erpetoichthys calabaricus TaxID=27687 RepID=A0A8C4SNX5_ERPCA
MVEEAANRPAIEQEAQQASAQEIQGLKDVLHQAESKVQELQEEADNLKKIISDREAEIKDVQENVSKLQAELNTVKQELLEKSNLTEQLRQQITEKDEKTKKAFMGAKQKIQHLMGTKDQLTKENEDLRAQKEEQEGRLNVLKSQYEGRICRLERELREQQERHHEQRDEPQEQPNKAEQRQITLKSTPTSVDRGSTSALEPPTANIKPTPLVPTPSKAAAIPGNKATPRATTVMPTTQVETQEAIQSEGPVEHVMVFGSTSGSVRSTSPNVQTTLSQTILNVQQQQTQATAFVQPTQQSLPPVEPASQDPSPAIVEVVQIERPSTSTAVFGTGCPSLSKIKCFSEIFCTAGPADANALTCSYQHQLA